MPTAHLSLDQPNCEWLLVTPLNSTILDYLEVFGEYQKATPTCTASSGACQKLDEVEHFMTKEEDWLHLKPHSTVTLILHSQRKSCNLSLSNFNNNYQTKLPPRGQKQIQLLSFFLGPTKLFVPCLRSSVTNNLQL